MIATPTVQDGGELRPIFRDAGIDAEFRTQGFVVIDGVTDDELAHFEEILRQVYVGSQTGFHATIRSGDFAYRRAVFDRLGPAFGPMIDRLLHRYEVYTSSLLIKWPTGDNGFVAHQDWTMVEEPAFRAVNLWVPLQDVDESNGTLAVLPTSHRVLDHLRCSPMNPVDFRTEENDVGVDEMVPIPVRRGEVLAFDSGVLHASGRNETDAPREVVVAACKPEEAPLLHYYLPDGSSWDVEVYEIAPDFFVDFEIGDRPRYPCSRIEQFRGTPRTRSELLELCAGGDRP